MKRVLATWLIICLIIGILPVEGIAKESVNNNEELEMSEVSNDEVLPKYNDETSNLEVTKEINAYKEVNDDSIVYFDSLINENTTIEVDLSSKAEKEVSGTISIDLVEPDFNISIDNSTWKKLLDSYIEHSVDGFANLSQEQCLEVMSEDVYNNQIIWIGLLEEENINVIGCTYTIEEAEEHESEVKLLIKKMYDIVQDEEESEIVIESNVIMTFSDDELWYVESDVQLNDNSHLFLELDFQSGIDLYSYSTAYPNTWTNTGDQAVDIAQIALTQVGYTETSNHTKYNAWFYGSDTSAAWCAIFISWCANQAGISTSIVKKNAIASGYTTSNMSANSFGAPSYTFGSATPKCGDIAYIDNDADAPSDHVGLIYAVDSNYIYTVEGNYSNKVSTVKYSRSTGANSSGANILFCARPNYSTSETNDNFNYTLRAWISDTAMGDIPGVFRTGHRYYLCYEVYDTETGQKLNTAHSGQQYTATEKIIRPDGSTQYEYSYSNSDNNWISNVMDTAGKYTGRVTLSGDLNASVDISWTVQDSLTVAARVWLSDSEYGDWLDEGVQGEKCWVCYELMDADSGTPVDELPGTSNYSLSMSVYNPDGTLVYGYTDYDDSGWISFTPAYVGNYTIEYTLDGTISGGTYKGTVQKTKYVAPKSYTITYNANGGSGAPASQTKDYGVSLTLSSAIPERFGYNFLGWSTNSTSTNANYQPGGSYEVNENATLYAVWKSSSTISSNVTNSGANAIIPYANQCKYYSFKPSFSGKVKFESSGDSDTQIYIYDASGNQLTSDDDSGDNTNFLLTYSVSTNTQYYIKVKHYGSGTGTISFDIKRVYDVIYNANGGNGAPAVQEKIYGTSLTLSETKPTRSGYTFLGWSTSSTSTSASYQSGGSYTANANATLYAVWSANSYTISYNANGGTGAPSSQTKAHGITLTLRTSTPTRSGYTFLGWSTSNTSTSVSYQPGGRYTGNVNVTLYAVWVKDSSGIEDNYNISRIYGKTRYETSYAIANALKEQLNVNMYDTVILANGNNFPDALAGSYLAKLKNAPILMAREKNKDSLQTYIRENLKTGGKIYVLGGTNAIPESVLNGLSGYEIQRISGKTRYETNLLILEEAGVTNEDILVCTGEEFADSLSASATGKPILLINNKSITNEQIKFLEEHTGNRYYIIGGEGAISKGFELLIEKYGIVERISGETRYETSVKVAQKFFKNTKEAVLAYAWNFPDGLCGGPLAMQMNAPLILTATKKVNAAVSYVNEYNIVGGKVLGGESLISDAAVRKIFALPENAEIK